MGGAVTCGYKLLCPREGAALMGVGEPLLMCLLDGDGEKMELGGKRGNPYTKGGSVDTIGASRGGNACAVTIEPREKPL